MGRQVRVEGGRSRTCVHGPHHRPRLSLRLVRSKRRGGRRIDSVCRAQAERSLRPVSTGLRQALSPVLDADLYRFSSAEATSTPALRSPSRCSPGVTPKDRKITWPNAQVGTGRAFALHGCANWRDRLQTSQPRTSRSPYSVQTISKANTMQTISRRSLHRSKGNRPALTRSRSSIPP